MKPVLSDAQQVFVVGETGGVRDILNAIDLGMADPTPTLHDTRAGYPPEWAGVVRTYNRAQRRSMARLAGVMAGRTGATVAECERWLHESGGDVCRAIGMMRRAAR